MNIKTFLFKVFLPRRYGFTRPCIDCKHCPEFDSSLEFPQYPYCGRPNAIKEYTKLSLVQGITKHSKKIHNRQVDQERHSQGKYFCGETGKFFEPKTAHGRK